MQEDEHGELGHAVLRLSIQKLAYDGVLPRDVQDKLVAMCKRLHEKERRLIEENNALRAIVRSAGAVLKEAC